MALAEQLRKVFENQKVQQNLEGRLDFGFNLDQVFSKTSKPLPHWITQGAVAKLDLNLWGGFHELITQLMYQFDQ